MAKTTKPRAKKKAAPAKTKPAGLDQASLTRGQLRKLNALRKSLGEGIADKAFAEWMEKGGGAPAEAVDKSAQLIADTVRELVLSGGLKIPRGGYLLTRGHGRVIVEALGSARNGDDG